MNKKYIHSIGVMSGTSLDGVDLVFVKFNKNTYQDFKILKAETYCYSETWQSTLQKAIDFTSKDLQKLDEAYGQFLGGIIVDFIKKNNIAEIDFIASHGHTILHQPEKGITLQIGSGKEIAKKTRLKTVSD
ncbi:anhydro-N-acetylmuramic acid kinase, partial [uncultured Polaribacter sp.]|uniref:anhydro-N-acetylmuramic acid kinase n=1 Tax=uncultured Polaribacter sp. TaxID=174711 RepID=UPI00259B0FD8